MTLLKRRVGNLEIGYPGSEFRHESKNHVSTPLSVDLDLVFGQNKSAAAFFWKELFSKKFHKLDIYLICFDTLIAVGIVKGELITIGSNSGSVLVNHLQTWLVYTEYIYTQFTGITLVIHMRWCPDRIGDTWRWTKGHRQRVTGSGSPAAAAFW